MFLISHVVIEGIDLDETLDIDDVFKNSQASAFPSFDER